MLRILASLFAQMSVMCTLLPPSGFCDVVRMRIFCTMEVVMTDFFFFLKLGKNLCSKNICV